MNIVTQESLTRAAYILVVMAGLITLFGAIVIYLDRRTKLNRKRKK